MDWVVVKCLQREKRKRIQLDESITKDAYRTPLRKPMSETRAKLEKSIQELEARLKELKAQLPAHSISPAMMIKLDELEDQLAEARQQLAKIDPPAEN
jgi:septal ring factor EnvC (AmiA/AmiB activator)